MEPGCAFARNYVPAENAEPIVLTHVRNCPDCQEESFLMLRGAEMLA